MPNYKNVSIILTANEMSPLVSSSLFCSQEWRDSEIYCNGRLKHRALNI